MTMHTTTIYKTVLKSHKAGARGLSKTIRADVKFGTPSDDCRGLGICKVVPRAAWRYADLKERRCSQAKAYIALSDRGELEFHFVRSTVCGPTFRRFFSGPFFTIKEAIDIPKTIANQLDLEDNRIYPGEYPIRELGELITVVFRS